MKLPAGEKAFVPRKKLTEYLLSATHPIGSTKAAFFREIGYNESNVELLEEALLDIARTADVMETKTTIYGFKYILEGNIRSPANTTKSIRTVWILEINRPQPRFITAYPV